MYKEGKNLSNIKLGINGFGRIGKLSLWNHLGRKFFKEIVINTGREVGSSIDDIVHYLERDSTYGSLEGFLYGWKGKLSINDIDEKNGCMTIDGIKVRFLRSFRNPAEIEWRQHDVRLVLDTTGQFLDPTLLGNHSKGSLRGHLEAGAEKVIASAPFKIKDKAATMPEDSVTTVMGINENSYDPRKHILISNASCTTTCLAHMVKPLLNAFGAKRLLSASMATVHAATGSQEVLDRLPAAGKEDLRKNRSIINNIILTTTGAAKALSLVIPEMEQIGVIAESVRIPTVTGSLVILVLNLREDLSGNFITRDLINDIYRKAAEDDTREYLHYSEKQNVSGDIIGMPGVAAIIESHETHTRTAEITIDLENDLKLDKKILSSVKQSIIRIPITQAVIYGWYDNEMGSYVNMLADRAITIAEIM